MTPNVSVVVPAYNYARYLPETLDCLARQTISDWECVIVDDGSTDDTPDICEAMARLDPRLTYHRQENRGLAAARNVGVALARGRYIQFLDADDLLAPEKLEFGVAVLNDEADVGVCYCNYRPMESETGRLQDRWTERMLGPDALEDFLLRWELDLCIPIHCALFRRTLWDGPTVFVESFRGKEDWLFWVDLALRGTRFHFIDRDQAFYRIHDRNMFQRHGEITPLLVEATLKILLKAPEKYRERFIEASVRRVRRSLEHWKGQEQARLEAEVKAIGSGA